MKITKEQIMLNPVRLITLNEPFASLMAFHNKQETRNRDTKVRGLVCIHAAKQAYKLRQILNISGNEQFKRIMERVADARICRGKIIAIGYLTGTKCMGDHPNDKELIEKKCFVQYDPKLWIWEFEDVTPIHPISFRGSQGWTILTPEQKGLIHPYDFTQCQ